MRRYLRLGGLGLWSAGTTGFARVCQQTVPVAERRALFQRHMKVWAKGLLVMFGVDCRLSPLGLPRARGARMVVSNHRSPIDIAVLLHHFGGCCVSRADLEAWPILGFAARSADTIFVDRESRSSGARAIRAMHQRLRQGQTVIVFPEGGTFEGDAVREFQPGPFAATRNLDVELVPVGLAYQAGSEFVNETFMEHVLRIAGRPRTRVAVKIGKGFAAEGSSAQMASRCQREVQRLVGLAREMCDRGAHASAGG